MKQKIFFILLFTFLIILSIGLIGGDLDEAILKKALHICYECIGIG